MEGQRKKFWIRSPRRLGQGGYTVIELVIALGIMGVLIFTVIGLFKIANRSLWQADEKSRLERALVFTMEQMVEEIRQARTITQLGPSGSVLASTNVHLDAPALSTGNAVTVCMLDMPNLTDALNSASDASLVYFLRRMSDGTVKLYQRMMYYDGTYTRAFPAMANVDQFRLGKPVTSIIPVEPTPGILTPVPSGAATPTPVYLDDLGRMPGVYGSSDLSFDDVDFFYNSLNAMVGVGLTMSLKSKSLSWTSTTVSRRVLTLTSSIALRRD